MSYWCISNFMIISNPKQPCCKSVQPWRRPWWKKFKIQGAWWSRNDCDGRLMAKILFMTLWICVAFSMFHYDLAPNSPVLSLLVFLPLGNDHSHFLVSTLDFISFSQLPSSGPHTFLQLGCFWIRFHFFLEMRTVLLAYCHH